MQNCFHRRLTLILSLATFAGLAIIAFAQEHTKDSLETIKKALAAKSALLIDVREKGEWDKGHLQDARLITLSSLKKDAKAPDDLAKDKAIYLHCGSGVRCLQAAEILKKQGYDVRPLKEGYQDLLKQGFPKAKE
jgi:phage shock protein E